MTDLAYNLLMLAVDVAALWAITRFRTARHSLWSVPVLAAAWAVALPLAFALASGFAALRLTAWGFFAHGFLLAGAGAILAARRSRILAALLGTAALALTAGAFDAFLVEPRWLEVTRVQLESPRLSRPLKIAVLADLQADEIGAFERAAIAKALAEEPDLVLLPGDYLQVAAAERAGLRTELNALLHAVGFSAPLGVFAVEGNTDARGWPAIFAGLPVEAVTERRSFARGEVRVTALSLLDSFDTRLEIPADEERFHVVFGHGPDFALGRVEADLLVAGHTHGGQVRLPVFGPPVTFSLIPRAWAAGATRLPPGLSVGERTLVVSRGLGMERAGAPELRFLCRPELVVVEVAPTARVAIP